MRIGANLTWLFTENEMLHRPALAAAAGFETVEVLFPYATPAADLRDAIAEAGLTLSLINTPPNPSRGRAALPDQVDAFRIDFQKAVEYAREAGAPILHVMSGITDASAARDTLVSNLTWAAAQTPDLMLTIEPLNPRDMPGYAVCDFMQAAAIVAEVSAPNLRLQFDSFHAQMIHGDALKVWTAVRRRVAHVQIAAAPDRTEPDDATLALLTRLAEDRYVGTVSAEYGPSTTTTAGLGWLSRAKKIALASRS